MPEDTTAPAEAAAEETEDRETGSPRKGKMDSFRHPIQSLRRFIRRIRGKGKAEIKGDVKLKGHKTDQKVSEEALATVTVEGEGLEGGYVGEPIRFTVRFPEDAGQPHLKADASGPSEPEVELEYMDEGEFSVTLTAAKPGRYKLALFWGSYDCPLPDSPYKFRVRYHGESESEDEGDVQKPDGTAPAAAPPSDPTATGTSSASS